MPFVEIGVNHALFHFRHVTRHLSGTQSCTKNVSLAGFLCLFERALPRFYLRISAPKFSNGTDLIWHLSICSRALFAQLVTKHFDCGG